MEKQLFRELLQIRAIVDGPAERTERAGRIPGTDRLSPFKEELPPDDPERLTAIGRRPVATT